MESDDDKVTKYTFGILPTLETILLFIVVKSKCLLIFSIEKTVKLLELL